MSHVHVPSHSWHWPWLEQLEGHGSGGFVDKIVNVNRLRAYKTRSEPASTDPVLDPDVAALCQDPRGGTWWEVDDVVAWDEKNAFDGVVFLLDARGPR